MSDELFVKVSLDRRQPVKKLIPVCAWCPKEEYPLLKAREDYTHGLCERHYHELRSRGGFSNG